ncbi:MAG TPA: hypothetical protein VFN55_06325 [Solirubrobacteraceae bacterium]|nr:hypothetical protein [Solirubrobacteraceae bacterium]
MDFQARRLRRGEMLAAAAALVLLVDLFALSWYTVSAGALSASANGWDVLTVSRWFILLAVAAAFALAWAQATHPAPALPSSLSVIATVLALIAAIILVFRVLLTLPGPDDALVQTGADAGAYIGLLAALVMFAGSLWSLREEDPPDPERNAAIPVVRLEDGPTGQPG